MSGWRAHAASLGCVHKAMPNDRVGSRRLRSPLGQAHGKPDRRRESIIKPPTRLTGSVPGSDHTVELQNLLLQPSQLSPECQGHARAISGTRLSFGSATTLSSSSTPWRPTGAIIPNSARWARIALITAVCWRMNRWRARWSTRPLCCSGVLVTTNRMLALVTASQMASASVASFFMPFDVGLHVGRWHQSHRVAKCLELTRPMVR